MIASADLAIGGAADRFSRQRFAGQDVIDTPTDIPFAQLAPGRPPGEEIIVVRFEYAADVDESTGEQTLEKLSFIGPLSDQICIALLGVDVALAARDIDVAAQHH